MPRYIVEDVTTGSPIGPFTAACDDDAVERGRWLAIEAGRGDAVDEVRIVMREEDGGEPTDVEAMAAIDASCAIMG